MIICAGFSKMHNIAIATQKNLWTLHLTTLSFTLFVVEVLTFGLTFLKMTTMLPLGGFIILEKAVMRTTLSSIRFFKAANSKRCKNKFVSVFTSTLHFALKIKTHLLLLFMFTQGQTCAYLYLIYFISTITDSPLVCTTTTPHSLMLPLRRLSEGY